MVRFHNKTKSQPDRLSVQVSTGRKDYYPFQRNLGLSTNYTEVMVEHMKKLGITGTMQGAPAVDGMVFVVVDHDRIKPIFRGF